MKSQIYIIDEAEGGSMLNRSTTNIDAFYHYYPRNTAAVGATLEGRSNLMAVAWSAPLSFKPPMYGVLIAEKRFTFHLIKRSGEFSVNFLPYDKLDVMHAFGRTSGKEVDKLAKMNLRIRKALKTGTPILEDSYAALECVLKDTRDYGDHTLFAGEVVAAHYDDRLFDAEGIIRIEELDPILYLGNNQYATSRRDSRMIKPPEIRL